MYFSNEWITCKLYLFLFYLFIEKNAFDFAYFTRLDFGNWHFALKNMQAINHVYKWPIASPVLFSFFGQAFYEIRICCILAIMILSFKCDETSNIKIFFPFINDQHLILWLLMKEYFKSKKQWKEINLHL